MMLRVFCCIICEVIDLGNQGEKRMFLGSLFVFQVDVVVVQVGVFVEVEEWNIMIRLGERNQEGQLFELWGMWVQGKED